MNIILSVASIVLLLLLCMEYHRYRSQLVQGIIWSYYFRKKEQAEISDVN